MQIQVIEQNDTLTHLALAGKLDIAGVHEIDVKFHAYTAGRRLNTVVDLSQVEFIASLGIGMLIGCAKSLSKHGAKMVILNPHEAIREVLTLSQLDMIVPVVDTQAQAEAKLAEA